MSSNPNSWLIRLRRWLAARIEPEPAPGEAWCLDCPLNNGRSLVISPDEIQSHMRQHPPGAHSTIQAAWPLGKGPS